MFNVLLSNDGLLGQTSIILWRPQHVLCYFWISFFQNLLLVDCSFGSSGDRQDSVGSILYRSFVSHFGIFIFQKSVSVPFLYINSQKLLNKSCWILQGPLFFFKQKVNRKINFIYADFELMFFSQKIPFTKFLNNLSFFIFNLFHLPWNYNIFGIISPIYLNSLGQLMSEINNLLHQLSALVASPSSLYVNCGI